MREDRESLGGLVMPVPAGWTPQHQVTIHLPPTGSSLDFQSNIVVLRRRRDPPDAAIDERSESGSIDAIVEQRRLLLERHLPQFEFGLTLWGHLFGRRSARMLYTWQNGLHHIRQALVMCAADGELYEITFSDASVRFRESVTEFDRWLATLELEPAGA